MVQGCNGVASMYRRTNKKNPKTPGYYIKDLLAFDDPLWKKKCRIYVLKNYASTVQKCLVNIKNVEESLKKLKKRRMNVTSGLGSANDTLVDSASTEDTDEFKMRLQFRIDMEQLLKDCESDELEFLAELKKSVNESFISTE